jgi:hypothetical protein
MNKKLMRRGGNRFQEKQPENEDVGRTKFNEVFARDGN